MELLYKWTTDRQQTHCSKTQPFALFELESYGLHCLPLKLPTHNALNPLSDHNKGPGSTSKGVHLLDHILEAYPHRDFERRAYCCQQSFPSELIIQPYFYG